jgi:hypothetical protein
MRCSQSIKIVILTVVLTLHQTTLAALVRGRLLRGPGTAPGIAVTVWNQQLGRSLPAYSQVDGMYYLTNIPPGIYVLEVWAGGNGQPPMTFNIQVNDPSTDINPVIVP